MYACNFETGRHFSRRCAHLANRPRISTTHPHYIARREWHRDSSAVLSGPLSSSSACPNSRASPAGSRAFRSARMDSYMSTLPVRSNSPTSSSTNRSVFTVILTPGIRRNRARGGLDALDLFAYLVVKSGVGQEHEPARTGLRTLQSMVCSLFCTSLPDGHPRRS